MKLFIDLLISIFILICVIIMIIYYIIRIKEELCILKDLEDDESE